MRTKLAIALSAVRRPATIAVPKDTLVANVLSLKRRKLATVAARRVTFRVIAPIPVMLEVPEQEAQAVELEVTLVEGARNAINAAK